TPQPPPGTVRSSIPRAAARATITPVSQPLYLKFWASPTMPPSAIARPTVGFSRNRPPNPIAISQTNTKGTSVSAFRENATWGIEIEAMAAAAVPAPGPKVRRPTQPATGIVAIPQRIDDRSATLSLTPRTRYATPTRSGKPGGAYGISFGSSDDTRPGTT